jgi:hypothetical protein
MMTTGTGIVDALGASVLRHGLILHLYRLMDNGARDRIPIGNSIFKG